MNPLTAANEDETLKLRAARARRRTVACFIPDLFDGGAQRAAVKLAGGLAARGLDVDLVLLDAGGPHRQSLDARVRVVELSARRVALSAVPLARYLARERPDALVSFLTHANIAAVAARSLSRTDVRLALVEQNTLTAVRSELRRDGWLPALARRAYTRADAVVAVSEGVAHDLVHALGLPPAKVSVIHNPVVDEGLRRAAQRPADHPWFEDASPNVFLAVGRLTPQKDFPTLIEAFRMLRESQQARLMILGEGEERARLEALVASKGLTAEVSLPGYVENPYAYMSRAAAFVLSSRWEGLPTVLVEALGCGCPVVATDCPSGPREILRDGEYGALVPVGDAAALCEAMGRVLVTRPNAASLEERAAAYSVERAVSQYLELLRLT